MYAFNAYAQWFSVFKVRFIKVTCTDFYQFLHILLCANLAAKKKCKIEKQFHKNIVFKKAISHMTFGLEAKKQKKKLFAAFMVKYK